MLLQSWIKTYVLDLAFYASELNGLMTLKHCHILIVLVHHC